MAGSLSTVSYSPGDPPADPAQLQRYLREEFSRLSWAIGALAAGHLDPVSVAPAKPRDGDIRYAPAGVGQWNPGAGAGIYWYNGATSAWVKL